SVYKLWYFVWLADQAASGLKGVWKPTAVLLAWTLVALLWLVVRSPERVRWGWAAQLAPGLVPIALLGMGAIGVCEKAGSSAPVQVISAYLLIGLVLLHLIGAGILIKRAARARIVAVPLQLLLLWCSFWAFFVAAMSVTGDWL